MRLPWIAHNTPCMACGEYLANFVRFGVLPFCDKCFDTIFNNVTIDEEKDRYKWWLQIYMKEEDWLGKNHMRRFKDEYDYKYADTPEATGTGKCGTCCCGQSITAD